MMSLGARRVAEQIHGEFLVRLGESAEVAWSRMLAFLGWVGLWLNFLVRQN